METTNGTTYTISKERVTVIGKTEDGRVIIQSTDDGGQLILAPSVLQKVLDKE